MKTLLILIVGLSMMAGFGFLSLNIIHEEQIKQRHEEYSAWVKYTGNSQKLTLEEYFALRNSSILSKHTDASK